MGDQYTVHYFDGRGAAEPIRLILSYAKVDFKDNRFPVSFTGNAIPAEVKALAPYGQVPLLEFNGQVMSQSVSIARFLARKYNLTGSNELEAARCDEIVDASKDFMTLWSPLFREQDEVKKAELKATIIKDSKARFLTKFSEILAANGNTGNFVGKKLTFADIIVAHCIDNAQRTYQVQLTDGLPELENLLKTVFGTPGIKEWVETRPNTQF